MIPHRVLHSQSNCSAASRLSGYSSKGWATRSNLNNLTNKTIIGKSKEVARASLQIIPFVIRIVARKRRHLLISRMSEKQIAQTDDSMVTAERASHLA